MLRHTGIRIEELTELSHHSLIQYRLPGTGELIPLLQIAPSKTDTERLLVISPELADVLAAIIARVRAGTARVPLVAAYDSHERVWNPPMPLLFQRRFGGENRPIAESAHPRAASTDALTAPASPTPPGSRCGSPRTTSAGCSSPTRSCTACRRTSPNSSPGTATSTPPWATRPSTPRKSSTATARSSPAAARCAPARNTAPRPTQEWDEFLGHFERRKVSLGHLRPLLRHPLHPRAQLPALPAAAPRPRPRPRLVEIRDNLIARIAEAESAALARRGRRPQGQPRRRRGQARPDSTRSPPAAARPSTSAFPPSPTSPAARAPARQ